MDNGQDGTTNPLQRKANARKQDEVAQDVDVNITINRAKPSKPNAVLVSADQENLLRLAGEKKRNAIRVLEKRRFGDIETARRYHSLGRAASEDTPTPIGAANRMMDVATNGSINEVMGGVPVNNIPDGNVPVNNVPMMDQTPNPHHTSQNNPQMTMGVVTNLDGTIPVASLDPTSRPMQQVQTLVVQEKPKKLRKGWIFAVIFSVFVAVFCIVTAVLIKANDKPDAIAEAIAQVFAYGIPKNIAIDGKVDVNLTKPGRTIDYLTLKINGTLETDTLASSFKVDSVATLSDQQTIESSLEEVYTAKGEGFLKPNNLAELVESITSELENEVSTLENDVSKLESDTPTLENDAETEDTTNDDAAGDTAKKSSTSSSTIKTTTNSKEQSKDDLVTLESLLEENDNVFIKLNPAELNTQVLGFSDGGKNNCETDLINNINNSKNTLMAIYRNYPFLSASTKGVMLETRGNTVYKVSIDYNALTSFFSALEDTSAIQKYEECRGLVTPAIKGSEMANSLKNLSEIYVEISNEKIITRVFFQYDTKWGNIVADLGLSYPDSLELKVPSEYSDLSEIIKTGK